MRIAQIILPGASEYERKSQRIDAAMLAAAGHSVTGEAAGADVGHVYGPWEIAAAEVRGLTIPFVSSSAVKKARFSFRRIPEPGYVLGPVGEDGREPLPEAVEDLWFEAGRMPADRRAGSRRSVGSFARASVKNTIEQTAARLHRFRDDIDWLVFDRPPTPGDLQAVDAWVDPAVEVHDFDGFTAEAAVARIAVVASRIPINSQRLEKGRTGTLVPPGDPNELAHAILGALFKREGAQPKIEAARQTASKFRGRQRLRVLMRMYENLTGHDRSL